MKTPMEKYIEALKDPANNILTDDEYAEGSLALWATTIEKQVKMVQEIKKKFILSVIKEIDDKLGEPNGILY